MHKKILFLFVVTSLATFVMAQDNFTYTPAKPKPGDTISFSYTNSGNLAGQIQIPEVAIIEFKGKKNHLIEVPVKREFGKFVGKVSTDTGATLLAFGFSINDKFDNNNNNGYLVSFYNGDSPVKGSYRTQADFFGRYGELVGVKADQGKIIESYEKEFALYPDNKDASLIAYLSNKLKQDKIKGATLIQEEIEKQLKKGLKVKEDYARVAQMYNLLKFPQQSTFFSKLKDEKFPSSDKNAMSYYNAYIQEKDIAKKADIVKEAQENLKDDESAESLLNYLNSNLAGVYGKEKNWSAFEQLVNNMKSNASKVQAYNSVVWKLAQDSTSNDKAVELGAKAVALAKAEYLNPKDLKPEMSTTKEWNKSRKEAYAGILDSYANALYKKGDYKKALPFATEAAITLNNGKEKDINTTYALIVSKLGVNKKVKTNLENFVREGAADEEVLNTLKGVYKKEHKSEAGYDGYIVKLQNEAEIKAVEKLKKEMQSDKAFAFALKDINGKEVSLSAYKGKVVILDFWATWCGPCIASFPGMQLLSNKYKNDPDVAILFIDSWEREENKEKNAKDFMTKKGYKDFLVLMDNDDAVIGGYGVSGIPTKFVIDKSGVLRFTTVGFSGSDEGLVNEMSRMIELARGL
ncbi:MAG: redoxin domain-containing protein [Bacteroidetes bacterium]|nr:redoxin domain-containing protein [Bacteroidota bacterium]